MNVKSSLYPSSSTTPLLLLPHSEMNDATTLATTASIANNGEESANIVDDASPADDPSSTSSSRQRIRTRRLPNPLDALSFLKRRTVDHWRNLSPSELSGSLGDLGTFIPLTVALARERKIALAPALFWAGVSNVVTGYMWDVPMCVQPMKSIAAVALTDVAAGTSGSSSATGLDAQSVTTAGILTGGAVLLLGVTNLMEVVNWIVPLTVVCGLQIGVGLRLASKGIQDIQQLSWGGGYDCIGVAIGCALLSMFWLRDNENGLKRIEMENTGQIASDNCQVAETVANSVTASSDGEKDGCCGIAGMKTEDDNCMELGRLNNAHKLETASTLQRQPQSSIATTANAAIGSSTFSSLLAPHRSSSSPASPSCFRQILKRTCCCLDPFPKTPHPVGIYLFLIGCVFATITLATAGPDSGYDLPLQFFGAPVAINAMEGVTALSWRQGFLQGTLPQLPLTTLNSVISVCCLAHALYPEKRDPALVSKRRTDMVVTRREVSISVGLMNLILCPLGSMPNCHGAGGLAGQHRFGARHGTSVAVLGSFKILLAVFLGGSALTLLDALPVAVLGVMLVIAGLELVGTGVGMLFECVQKEQDQLNERVVSEYGNANQEVSVNSKAILRKNALISMVTAGVIIALQKTHYGAISGWVVHMVYGDGFLQFVNWAKNRRNPNKQESGEEEERRHDG